MTRKELEKYRGLTYRQMINLCPDALHTIRKIMGKTGTPYQFMHIHSNGWQTESGENFWFDDTSYWPTKEQIDTYYAPETKFTVGDIWRTGHSGYVMRIDKINDGHRDNCSMLGVTILASYDKMLEYPRTDGYTHVNTKKWTKFYDIKCQDTLAAEGWKADCIGPLKEGDAWVPPSGTYFLTNAEANQADSWVHGGLRYILKRIEKKHTGTIKRLKEVIERLEKDQ